MAIQLITRGASGSGDYRNLLIQTICLQFTLRVCKGKGIFLYSAVVV